MGKPSDHATLSRKEVRDAYRAALLVALHLTRSTDAANELAQQAFERLLTTRPWHKERGPFEQHLVGIVVSLRNIEHRSHRPAREAALHDGFQRDGAGFEERSFEDVALERAADKREQEKASDVLARLEKAVAKNPVAVAVLRLSLEQTMKPAEMARALGVPVEQIYRSKEMLQYHLDRLRKAATGEVEDEP